MRRRVGKPFSVVLPDGPVTVHMETHPQGRSIYARWWYRGKPHRQTTKTDVLNEAMANAHAMVWDAARITASSPFLANLVADYLDERWPKGGHRTRENYASRLNRFVAHAGINSRIPDFEGMVELAESWFAARRLKYRPDTVRTDRAVLHHFCRWARKAAGWPANPIREAETGIGRQRRTPKPPIPDADLWAFLESIKAREVYPLCVLALSGVRPRGIFNATWEGVDLDARRIVLNEPGKPPRVLPLGEWAAGELAFPGPLAKPKGKVWPYTPLAAHHAVRRLQGGKPLITLGRLRATGEYWLHRAGVSAKDAARLMGHSVSVSEKHYVDFTAMDAHGAADHIGPAKQPAKPESPKRRKSNVKAGS